MLKRLYRNLLPIVEDRVLGFQSGWVLVFQMVRQVLPSAYLSGMVYKSGAVSKLAMVYKSGTVSRLAIVYRLGVVSKLAMVYRLGTVSKLAMAYKSGTKCGLAMAPTSAQ